MLIEEGPSTTATSEPTSPTTPTTIMTTSSPYLLCDEFSFIEEADTCLGELIDAEKKVNNCHYKMLSFLQSRFRLLNVSQSSSCQICQ